ncbi:MAG: zinc ribbon domain-containing protein [Methanobacteriaceae archaeon]|nr:zinc ribbon domain-containing protein [Methanobacteriaceae archaeon]
MKTCEKCGAKNENTSKYCLECGANIVKVTWADKIENELWLNKANNQSGSSEDLKEKHIRSIAAWLGLWGIINLIFLSPIGGGILIFFAVLAFAFKSLKALYAFSIVWLLIASLQLIFGALIMQGYFLNNDGPAYIFVAIINFAFGLWIIYKTRKFE